jgi:hypothetical protein
MESALATQSSSTLNTPAAIFLIINCNQEQRPFCEAQDEPLICLGFLESAV